VQRLCVDGLGSFVGSSEPIARLVDLGLGKGLNHQEVSDGVAGLTELTVGGNYLRTLNHALNLVSCWVAKLAVTELSRWSIGPSAERVECPQARGDGIETACVRGGVCRVVSLLHQPRSVSNQELGWSAWLLRASQPSSVIAPV